MWFNLKRVELDYVARAPYRLRNEATIPVTGDAVFHVLNSARWESWCPDLEETQWLTALPHSLGAQREVRLGRFRWRERVMTWHPGKRFSLAMDAASLPILSSFAQDIRMEPKGQGSTRLIWEIVYDPALALIPFQSIFKMKIARTLEKGFHNLVERSLKAPRV